MIKSPDIDVSELFRNYGVKTILESMIRLIGFTDYELKLRMDLQTALDNYNKRYNEENKRDRKKQIKETQGRMKDTKLTTDLHLQWKDKPERIPEKQRKIKRNAISCKYCFDEIESKSVHDYVTCKCGIVSVDGGKDYLKRTYKNGYDDYIELSEHEE